jgi:uncharacterized damage-inducible protein DinB
MSVDLRELARHAEWADAVAWKAVLASDAARADERIRILLYHVHLVQRAFLHVWRREQPEFPEPSVFPDLLSLARWGREGHHALQAHLASMTEEDLARELVVPWADEVPEFKAKLVAHPTVEQTVMQVILHSSHHRGQINMRAREAGGQAEVTDYIAWVWQGRQAPDWSWLSAEEPRG